MPVWQRLEEDLPKPITPPVLNPHFGRFVGNGINWKEFDQVLEGTFEPPDLCDPFTKKVLTHLKRPEMV